MMDVRGGKGRLAVVLVAFALFVPAAIDVGCGNVATGSGIPLCKNPPSQESACASCVNASCSAEIAPAVATCSAYFDCNAQCDCADDACLQGCEVDETASCDEALADTNPVCAACESACSTTIVLSDASIPLDALGPAGDCITLSDCCYGLSDEDSVIECSEIAGDGVTAVCTSELSTYCVDGGTIEDAGLDGESDGGDDGAEPDASDDGGDDASSPCAELTACCPTLPVEDQVTCEEGSSAGNEPGCTSFLSSYMSMGLCE